MIRIRVFNPESNNSEVEKEKNRNCSYHGFKIAEDEIYRFLVLTLDEFGRHISEKCSNGKVFKQTPSTMETALHDN
ncbi:hypothetical protein NPIL_460841 [Nephila pilipes]|uniref:Uncharacterized protein n=1 Tax=Nephila pilipes TaxID=299642 RepID=A0A8X6TZC4_NEPPI|nr:hypothetical protein NPIL_460841 [Nephila pilipes]